MEIDLTDARGYSLEQADLPSGDGVVWQYPRGRQIGADGPLLQVSPEGRERWIARFAGEAYESPSVLPNRVFAMPDGATFCVLAGGTGYIASAVDPDTWVEVDEFPITCCVKAERVVAFGGFSGMSGYVGVEEVWSVGLFLDELAIESIEGKWLHVTGYDMGETMRAAVDITTGQVR